MPSITDAAAPETRLCTRCGQHLPVAEFARRRDGRFIGWCRSCNREHGAAYRARLAARRAAAVSAPAASVSERKFGIEFEFVGSIPDVVAQIRSRGLRAEHQDYNHQVRTYWKIVPDGSVRGGGELVSPPLSGEEGRAQVRTVCEALAAAGARVTSSCGTHVHHDMTGLDAPAIIRAVRGYVRSHPAFDGLVSPSRRGSGYATPLSLAELGYIEECRNVNELRMLARRLSRFRSVNVSAYAKYGTVEMRQHQGTLNAKKILAWVELGQALFAAAAAGVDVTVTRPEDLLDALREHGLSEETAAYLRRRAEAFRTATGGRRVRSAASSRY